MRPAAGAGATRRRLHHPRRWPRQCRLPRRGGKGPPRQPPARPRAEPARQPPKAAAPAGSRCRSSGAPARQAVLGAGLHRKSSGRGSPS
eukprot:15230761-Alexandrium_andersonii.AAC.1